MSQNFDLGLSFGLWYVEEGILKKITKNHYRHPKNYTCRLYIKRDICVQKTKVKILVINSPSSQYLEFRHVSYIIR